MLENVKKHSAMPNANGNVHNIHTHYRSRLQFFHLN